MRKDTRTMDEVRLGFIFSPPSSCSNQARRHADAPYAHALLRARRERPRGRHAADERDEIALVHSMTSSASARSLSGTVRPSIRAVGTLMTSSNLVDCTTGRSAGFVPLRMRPAYAPI